MAESIPRTHLRDLVLWPALITLAITVLRFAGELLGWSPRYFSRSAGGGAALIGIVWLIPVFGVYFARRLSRENGGPPDRGRAIGFGLLALVVGFGSGAAIIWAFRSPVAQLGLFTITCWVAVLLSRFGWPALWRVLLAYAFSARVPVLLLMLVSIFGGLDTHYAKPRPDFPPMGPAGLFFWTALLPQFSVSDLSDRGGWPSVRVHRRRAPRPPVTRGRSLTVLKCPDGRDDSFPRAGRSAGPAYCPDFTSVRT
jgi:hypothetical protein